MKNTVYADLDTMVFEGRELDYGAYQMRSRYNRILSRSVMIAFLLFLSITGLPKVVQWMSPKGPNFTEMMVPFPEMDEVPDLQPREEKVEEPPLPPETRPEPRQPVATIEFRIVEPAPEDQADDDASMLDQDEVLDADTMQIGFNNQDGIGTDGMGDIDWDGLIGPGTGTGGPIELTGEDEDPGVGDFFAGEEPRPINIEGIRDLIGYPPRAVEAEIEGKVTVRVLVDKTGKYKEHVVLKDPHPILTKAVERELKGLVFTPGIQNNKPVKVWVTIPFQFTLNH